MRIRSVAIVAVASVLMAGTVVPAASAQESGSLPGKLGAHGCGLSQQAVRELKTAGKHTVYCASDNTVSSRKAPDPARPTAAVPTAKPPSPTVNASSGEPGMCIWAEQIPGQWPEDRDETCMAYEETIWADDLYTGRTIGQMNIKHRTYEQTDIQSGTWRLSVRVEVEGIAGRGFEDAKITGTWGCAGACTLNGWDTPDQYINFAGAIWIVDKTFSSWVTSPGQVQYAASWLDWSISSDARGASTPFESAPQHLVRCDDAVPYIDVVGCDFNDYLPTFEVYRFRYPAFFDHLSDAMASGLPGRAPNPLHRLTDQTRRTNNNNVACPRRFTRPAGYECDEYPFQSTKEGAAEALTRDGNARGRTSWWCQLPDLPTNISGPGWSSCMIPAAQNSLGGTDLLQFYFYNRIIDDDAFYIELYNE